MIDDPTYLAKLNEWNAACGELLAAKTKEHRLRMELFTGAFPSAVEGTQYVDLPGEWRLKGVLKMNRSIDKAALPAVLQAVAALGTNPDPVVEYKPELVLKHYKALPEQARKLFDTALTIKPGLPTIELVPPKET